MMENFKDYFSRQSDLYVKYRPQYPPELFSYLASLTGGHHLAWDCGTGNGQAAVSIAGFYEKVIATDPSEAQIRNAFPHEKVEYRIGKAEDAMLSAQSVDLVTVANALHWFDFDSFYAAIRKVLKKDGIIAAFAYGTPSISTEVDEIVMQYHDVLLADYWLPENHLVEKKYTTIPFPFTPVSSPGFIYQVSMNLEELTGYLNTWSATQRYIDKNKVNPTEEVHKDLQKIWGNEKDTKILTWELILKVGRI